MKRVLAILALALPLTVFADNHKGFTVNAEGMTCGACVKKVEDKMAALKGEIKGLVIKVEQNKATVDLSKAKLTPEKEQEVRAKVEKAIVDAGFKVVAS